MNRPVFIDTDTASDDAVALMMAFASSEISLLGIGVVAGNVPLSIAVQNALYMREMCSADVPIYEGADKPLMRDLETAQHVHGNDGMGDIGLQLEGRKADAGHAVLKLIEAARAYPGSLELVTLGPLTNVALALSLAPDIATKIKRCVIMGGASDAYGNITPVSEFNLWSDPEAAQVVFGSDMAKVMVGWDISRKYAVISDDDAATLRQIGTDKAIVAMDTQATVRDWCANTSGVDGFDFPDPIAMAIALQPEAILESHEAAVSVRVEDGPVRGMAIVDTRNYTEQTKSTTVVTRADRDVFMDLLRKSLH